ncbi:thioredoxin-like protein Clot [Physcomitrium patens]|uniref:Thioredoxin domain-containing protein n=1 Tax=Physcomitrium patens TaxID=3218 RepID=A0A2K1L6P1_PHYPA|nr:thioredoxin-like protein Clot [Physcomitrium patens]PNR61699.1 hypothetical protein PHYPA_000122 [Physcomitrium patens]|eukprot:XP_024395982.1 thioredoxin-like protein Clot [Physcomitrella patens]
MPAAIVDAGLGDFETILKTAELQGPGVLLLLFLGDRIASVGKSWCPDCVRAEPIIYKLVNESESPVTLVRVYVGDKPTWRTSDHPLRCDDRFKLKGVPTLIRWENGAISGRLEDYEADKEMKIKELLKSSEVQTKTI